IIATEWFAMKVVLDSQIQETKFAAQIVDISDFEKNKMEVLEKERRYEHMLEHFPVVLYCCEASGDFPATYISKNVEEIFGYKPSQFVDDPGFWANNIFSDDKERVFKDLEKLFEFGTHAHEYRFKLPNGKYIWVRDELNLVKDKNGSPLEIIGSWTICEEAKQAYLALESFKATLDMTLDCVFIFDADSLYFTYVNKGATEQVGYTETELKRMHSYDIKPEFTEEQFRALIQPLIDKEISRLNFETTHIHRDGYTIPVEIFIQYIEIQNEAPRFVAIVRDITDRRKVEKMKEEFVSTVSHELRTPLTSVFGAISLMKSELENDERCSKAVLKFVDIAYKNSMRLSTLISDIIDMEKMANGVLGVYLKPCLIFPLIRDSIDENSGFAQQFNVTYRLLDTPLENCIVNIDSSRLSQVMANLLSNAAKYTQSGDEVVISLTAHYGDIRISVTDHGRGIPEEIGDRIFERFVQIDSSDTRIGGGSGLGLSICKYLVEKMNGKIGYFKNSRGEGTTFFVDLPKE
ncbi:MAG: ATP-binding protein, partial [Gammaproteobacteria bacterium]|nr:ATP-binding protein [Gammaproteobacteria bacterium]